MKAIILYYSLSGHTRKAAEKLARSQGAEVVEIKTVKPVSKLRAFLVECPRAMMRKPAAIQPVAQDLKGYDLITLMGPVWASHPAPAFNAAIELLPKGKNVQLILVSAGGAGATHRSEQATRALVKQRGCSVVAYKDVKQSV
ncbi:MAG: NAD(P)H-dependent oxidoreductase [Candidatus Limiplasma sp.]|nr:NAD(P)H-dependent oxidoreductase [Candidatus Limiplasma sp.]